MTNISLLPYFHCICGLRFLRAFLRRRDSSAAKGREFIEDNCKHVSRIDIKRVDKTLDLISSNVLRSCVD